MVPPSCNSLWSLLGTYISGPYQCWCWHFSTIRWQQSVASICLFFLFLRYVQVSIQSMYILLTPVYMRTQVLVNRKWEPILMNVFEITLSGGTKEPKNYEILCLSKLSNRLSERQKQDDKTECSSLSKAFRGGTV